MTGVPEVLKYQKNLADVLEILKYQENLAGIPDALIFFCFFSSIKRRKEDDETPHKKALPDARKRDLIPPLPLSGRTVPTFRYY